MPDQREQLQIVSRLQLAANSTESLDRVYVLMAKQLGDRGQEIE
jgi:hypothetical protein